MNIHDRVVAIRHIENGMCTSEGIVVDSDNDVVTIVDIENIFKTIACRDITNIEFLDETHEGMEIRQGQANSLADAQIDELVELTIAKVKEINKQLQIVVPSEAADCAEIVISELQLALQNGVFDN